MENYNYLLGFLNPLLFGTMVLFAALGIAISLLWDAQSRDQNSPNTPVKFSFKFLLKDNWKTILTTAIAVLVTLRFAPLLFPDQFKVDATGDPKAVEWFLFGSFGIGLLYNQLVQFLKKKISILNVER
jgi:hypothetical protein